MSLDSHFLLVDPNEHELHGLVYNDCCYVFKSDEAEIYFSVSRIGGAASCHFSAAKKELRKVKHSIDEFTAFVFWLFPWCNMVITMLPDQKKSIERMIKKLGFLPFVSYDGGTGYMRCKDG